MFLNLLTRYLENFGRLGKLERDYPDPFLFFSDGIGAQKILFDREGSGSSGLVILGGIKQCKCIYFDFERLLFRRVYCLDW